MEHISYNRGIVGSGKTYAIRQCVLDKKVLILTHSNASRDELNCNANTISSYTKSEYYRLARALLTFYSCMYKLDMDRGRMEMKLVKKYLKPGDFYEDSNMHSNRPVRIGGRDLNTVVGAYPKE